MPRSKSSRRWLKEHFDDAYVQEAKQRGLRSRAALKLLELDERDRLFRPGMTVVDLGAAPGGWAQVAAQRVGDTGRVFALDILPMDPLPGVDIITGDFREESVLETLIERLEGRAVDLVISDMAPNISGVKAVDQPRAMYLTELAFDCARRVLAPGGDLLVKGFHGEGFDAFVRELRDAFERVTVRKPRASRARSPEVYLLARNFVL